MKKAKLLSYLFALAILAAFPVLAGADAPSDWAAEGVAEAERAGLVPDNLRYGYTAPIARAGVARMVINLLEQSAGMTLEQLLLESSATIDPQAFTDTNDEAVLACNALGIIRGVGDGLFDPQGTLTRGQMAAIINRAAGVLGFVTTDYPHSFADTKGTWVDGELGWCVHVGIINGVGEGQFDPEGWLTTEQAILIIGRALKSTTAVTWLKSSEKILQDGEELVRYVWRYDRRGNAVAIGAVETAMDGYSHSVTCSYNAYGDRVSEGEDYAYTYQYDSSGRVLRRNAFYSNALFQVTEYSYAADGTVTERETYDGENWTTVAYAYDSQGNLAAVRTDGLETIYSYDEEGRVLTENRRYADGRTEQTHYSYILDGQGRVTRMVETVENGLATFEHDYEYVSILTASLPVHWIPGGLITLG